MERIALIIGINEYQSPEHKLFGCVNDAKKIKRVLSLHDNGLPNFDCRKTFTSDDTMIDSQFLSMQLENFFLQEADIALLYFAGHGFINNLGGFLVTQDARTHRQGINMTDVLTYATSALAKKIIKDVVIILDCCHSGAIGQIAVLDDKTSLLPEGLSILAASRKQEESIEVEGEGEFTKLVCNALCGGAADMWGKVTTPQIYSYVVGAIKPYGPRPMYKTNVSKLISLRDCELDLELSILRFLIEYFPCPDAEFKLNPSFVPNKNTTNLNNEKIFLRLQKFYDSQLLTTFNEENLISASLNSKVCKLTDWGKYYWNLIKDLGTKTA